MPTTSKKKKRKRINARCDAEYQALRHNVQRRVGSTRHELMRQLPPVPSPVDSKIVARKEKIIGSQTECVYCTAKATTSDHFEPLVVNGIPSGTIPTDLEVVPCCSWCNSSKGGRAWQTHMARLLKTGKLDKESWAQRMSILTKYSKFREEHAQRWDVERYRNQIDQLNLMVNDCHAFMQNRINSAGRAMHGDRGIQVYARECELDWAQIQTQIQNHKNDGLS